MMSNCLTMIPEEMSQLRQLKDVNFSDNRITALLCNFQELTNLEIVTLSNNNIEVRQTRISLEADSDV